MGAEGAEFAGAATSSNFCSLYSMKINGLSVDDYFEAMRMAKEFEALYQAGIICGPDDPDLILIGRCHRTLQSAPPMFESKCTTGGVVTR
jgi:hypothetical protein